MNRTIGIGTLTATFLLFLSAVSNAKPNVLFIAIDDLRPELGCYGDAYIQSPNIDKLAASGRLFLRAYCQQAVCNPSRSSLMTGLRPDSIGVTGNHIHFRSNRPDVVTLSQHFKQHGYRAQSIGKIYHGVFPDGSSKTTWDTMGDPESWSVPTTRFGPRYYYTESGIEQAKRSFLKMYRRDDPGPDDWTEKLVFGPMTESPQVADETLYDGKVAAKAVETIRQLGQTKQPFFLAVGFIKPHSPFVAPKRYWDLYDSAEIPISSRTTLPEGAPKLAGHRSGEIRRYTDQPNSGAIPDTNQRRMKHGYYACISYIDTQLGKVLDALESNGLAENTIVVLFGDHGYHLGEHGLWGKTTNFELDTRVPLIIRMRGMNRPGTPTRSIVELVDLYPTLAELAGLPIADDLEGSSLAPVVNDPLAESNSTAISQFPRGKTMGYSLRTDRWRYTEWIENNKSVASELYDHQVDNAPETENVAAANGQLVNQLSNQLREETSQRIVGVTVEDVEVPVLIGVEQNALLRIRIETRGSLQPLSVTSMQTSIAGNVTHDDIASVEVLASEDFVRKKNSAKQFGKSGSGIGSHQFSGRYELKQGVNDFWLSCELKERADIDRVIQVSCESVSFSDGSAQQPENRDVKHRLGVAVRQHRQDGVHTCRIPGLATTNEGTLIGVYDLRYRSSGDLPGNIDVGMSRSTDGGRTWEPNRVIMDMGDDKQWRYDGIGDPAVLVDRTTGTIWVAATWSHGNRSWTGSGPGMTPEETGQLMLVRSDDDGATWSKPINITDQVKQPEWCFLLAGPGKGITMRDGTLVFAAQYQMPEDDNRQPHSTIIYSMDQGKSWQIGSGALGDTTESQVVEVEPGVLMLNCRYDLESLRAVMTTRDMGKTWQKHPTSQRALIEPQSCMASLIDVDQEIGKDVGNWLLFSNPDDTESRRRIMIKASSDDGKTWPKQNRLLLDEGTGRGYSCMSMIDEQTIGILYESSRADLAFQRILLDELTGATAASQDARLNPEAGPTPAQIKADERPNILLIVGEDHGCELSCYGDPVINTPNIDALASAGMLFEKGYVTQSVCSPSRSTIFTGLYPHQNGQLGLATHSYGWFEHWPTTYALLKKAGYRTGLIGKTHVIPADAVESFVDFRFQPKSNFAKKQVAEYAVKAGEFFRDGDAPFFMTVNYPDAHWPLQGKVDGLPETRVSPERVQVMPYVGGETPRLRKIAQNYYNCMLRLDACVGQLLSELSKTRKQNNTLVIFIGDHGAQMARGKVTVYEGGLRVPFIARWPGVISPGQRSETLVSTIDLLPTFMDAGGSRPPSGLPGKSLRPVFEGTARDGEFRRYLACERNCDAAMHTFPQRTIRDARYKLIHSPVRDREDPAARYYRTHGATHWSGCLTDAELAGASRQTKEGYARWTNPPEYQLYDLNTDPHEWNDLSDDPAHGKTKQRLQNALAQWQNATRDPIADLAKLKLLMNENDAVARTKLRAPENGWQYLQYLHPDRIR